MTGEEFVKLCHEEKEAILKDYFALDSKTVVSEQIQNLIENGTNERKLFSLVSSILDENYYTLLLALDGEASLGNKQMTYKLYDEDDNLINECGEIEEAAFTYFMDK